MRAVSSAVGAVVVSAGLFYLGTGEKPLWWATWLAALPLLIAAMRMGIFTAFGMGALAWFLGGLNMLQYTRNILAIPNKALEVTALSAWIAIFLFIAVPAFALGLGVALFGSAARRGALWRAVFVFPGVWVAFEYLNSFFSPHGTFGNLAYTQMSALPVLQLAAVTGMWGISFLLFLFPAAITVLFSPKAA
jgi:apolipoprotein N-acyltransferase